MKLETARIEHRFFLPLQSCAFIKHRLETNRHLKRVQFPKQITETIYFTLRDSNLSVPDKLYVRMRKYVKDFSDIVIIDNSSAFLEIKTKDNNKSFNSKYRFEIEAKSGVLLLMEPGQRFELAEILSFLPPMFPAAATQTKRSHWCLNDKLRITLDEDVFFFGFFDEDWFIGYQIGNLGEGKIELKSKADDADLANLEDEILTGTSSRVEQPFYFERRLRECYKKQMAAVEQFN